MNQKEASKIQLPIDLVRDTSGQEGLEGDREGVGSTPMGQGTWVIGLAQVKSQGVIFWHGIQVESKPEG